ncbi:MAG: UbiD family decarboxylase [Thermodesulfobacteriota bacterium]|nr:UbiD family decarboxylase [Thermodesulfobacteriota bacterium]
MHFRHHVAQIRSYGNLITIQAPVSPTLELSAIVNRVVKQQSPSPALLFAQVCGSRWPIMFNMFGVQQRISSILSGSDGVSAGQRIRLLGNEVSGYLSFGSWLAKQPDLSPQYVESPPMIDGIDLSMLPQLQIWPEDAGSYLSMSVVISRTLSGQHVNCGMYRIQLHDSHLATIHWRPGSDGQRIFDEYRKAEQLMPVVIVLGCDPALTFSAGFPLPPEADEFQFAAFIQQTPVNVFTSKVNGLPVPTPSEFVLEGFVDPQQTMSDGPFGNHQGFYSDAVQCPTFHLHRLSARADAILPATVIGPPPMETGVLGQAFVTLILPLLQREIAQVIDIYMPLETIFVGCTFIRLRVDDEIDKAKEQLSQHPLFDRAKLLVFVDESIDVQQPQQVFWRVLNQQLDRAVQMNTGRIVIDATGWRKDGRNEVLFPEHVEHQVTERWREYGL